MLKIAFFDSGIGGLTVLAEAVRELPGRYIYYADTKHAPYGIKPKEEVRRYIFEAVDFLAGKDIQALVVACNTATAVAIRELRARYSFPIIGMEPAVKPAVLKNGGKKILVLATSLTLGEDKLETLIDAVDPEKKTVRREMDALVPFAEAFDFTSQKVRAYIRGRLSEIGIQAFETIVLGCTHFTYYKTMIQEEAGPHIDVIDGNEGTVKHLKRILSEHAAIPETGCREIDFYSSAPLDGEKKEKLAAMLAGMAEGAVTARLCDLFGNSSAEALG